MRTDHICDARARIKVLEHIRKVTDQDLEDEYELGYALGYEDQTRQSRYAGKIMMQTDIPHVTLTTYSQEGVDLAKALTRIEKLETAIKAHNDKCTARCANRKACNYATFCGACPMEFKIGLPE